GRADLPACACRGNAQRGGGCATGGREAYCDAELPERSAQLRLGLPRDEVGRRAVGARIRPALHYPQGWYDLRQWRPYAEPYQQGGEVGAALRLGGHAREERAPGGRRGRCANPERGPADAATRRADAGGGRAGGAWPGRGGEAGWKSVAQARVSAAHASARVASDGGALRALVAHTARYAGAGAHAG